MNRRMHQSVLDLVRFINVINDLFDVLGWQLRGIDPDTGGTYTINTNGVQRVPTVQEIKDTVIKTLASIEGYRKVIADYLALSKLSDVAAALTEMGFDTAVLQADILNFKNVRQYLIDNKDVTTKAELTTLGEYVEAHIPKLGLVRRTWAL